VWRQLGFSLAEIRALLDDPDHDRVFALRRQRELVDGQLERLGATARALDAALAAHANGTEPQEATMFEGFKATDYEDEARERWGDTNAYHESAARTAGYGEREWREIGTQSELITTDFAAALAAGEPATAESVRAIAERHRRHISEWFYACSPQLHRGLGSSTSRTRVSPPASSAGVRASRFSCVTRSWRTRMGWRRRPAPDGPEGSVRSLSTTYHAL